MWERGKTERKDAGFVFPCCGSLAATLFIISAGVQELEEHLKRQRGLEVSLGAKMGDGGSKVRDREGSRGV